MAPVLLLVPLAPTTISETQTALLDGTQTVVLFAWLPNTPGLRYPDSKPSTYHHIWHLERCIRRGFVGQYWTRHSTIRYVSAGHHVAPYAMRVPDIRYASTGQRVGR
eukprot:1638278-Rhodomonas_salina.1